MIIPGREKKELTAQPVSLSWTWSVPGLFIFIESYFVSKLEVTPHTQFIVRKCAKFTIELCCQVQIMEMKKDFRSWILCAYKLVLFVVKYTDWNGIK